MTQGILIYQVDAFTDYAFRGNPAAVCILHQEKSDSWMQQIAAEMNLSETAFLTPQGGDFQLRWFTPTVEVDLCGHATLASAHILWESGYLYPGEDARFHTRSGLLTARRLEDHIEMDFPAIQVEPVTPPPGLIDALGVAPAADNATAATAATDPHADVAAPSPAHTHTGPQTLPQVVAVGKNRFDYLVELASEAEVHALRPDFSALARVEARGIIVTSQAQKQTERQTHGSQPGSDRPDDVDFISRFFAPAAGVNEDPVTGSAHCALGPYWAAKLHKNTFTAYQASARGGVVQVVVDGDRVRLGGRAVTVLRGEFV